MESSLRTNKLGSILEYISDSIHSEARHMSTYMVKQRGEHGDDDEYQSHVLAVGIPK